MPKYAVIVEKSRKEPSVYGYPANNVTYRDFIEFDDEAALIRWVTNSGGKYKYRVIRFSPVNVVTEVKISVSDELAGGGA